jgi:hypothetical protein
VKPQRIKLSRLRGFRLQDVSRAINGLPARAVTRPGIYGNPFTKENALESGYTTEENWRGFVVECFREWLEQTDQGRSWWQGPESDKSRAAILGGLRDIRGMNLACHCKLDQPCHADVLLELANREGEE